MRSTLPTFSESTHTLAGGAFEVTAYEPAQRIDPVPVILVPGWAITDSTQRPAAEELSRRGRQVLALASRQEGPDTANAVTMAAALPDTDRVDVVAQSAGACAALLAASAQPEHFRSIVLVDPAGLQGDDGFLRLAMRFHAHILRTLGRAVRSPADRGRALGYVTEGTAWIARSPVRAMRTAVALPDTDLRPLLLEAQANGINIGIISGADDSLMPMAGLQRTVTRAHCDLFLSVQGEHHELYLQPEQYAGAVSIALDLLARRPGRQ